MKNYLIITVIFLGTTVFAQPNKNITIIDKVIAVVGNEIVLKSDIDVQKSQILANGGKVDGDCSVLEDLLYEKLLLNQAKLDSIEISESQIQSQLDRRISVFVQQIGSVEKLEEYYGKSIGEIKDDFHDVLKDQMLVQQMQSKVAEDVKVTPSDVNAYYQNIPKDSLPFINASVQLAQIVVYPEESDEEVKRISDRLKDFTKQVKEGKDFATLAVLYSDDPGSAVKGGELGMQPRGTFVPEFDAVAFGLTKGEVSGIIKTQFGYHIMQLIERRGEQYNARHILLKPKIGTLEIKMAQNKLDSIRNLISIDSITFEQAALKFSQDDETKNQNGNMLDPQSGTSLIEMSVLDPQIFIVIDSMNVSEVSRPAFMQTPDGKKAYRIIKLKTRTEPHKANLKDDYQAMQESATQKLNIEATKVWVKGKIGNNYVRIDDNYSTCNFNFPWVKQIK
jgi:peptidyl-prolyl cis-trans isomerase SurA